MATPVSRDIPETLPDEGKERIRREVRRRHQCDRCGGHATRKLRFLVEDGRRNPASSAFGRDDCSYCSDYDAFACEKCEREVECTYAPRGMRWSSTSYATTRNQHMFLYWEEYEIETVEGEA